MKIFTGECSIEDVDYDNSHHVIVCGMDSKILFLINLANKFYLNNN